jgi:hypothetical protein
MSVDFYSCDCCGESRYEECVHHCDKCQHSLCTYCLVNDDINDQYTHQYCIRYDGSDEMKKEYGIDDEWIEKGWVEVGGIIDDTGIDPKYCPFCTGEKVAKEDVFDYLIKKLGLDYEELKQEFLANK